ncbi:het containing protein [Fusarium langsethiae]|uniref:Het containing protein n=1 Tax=Fusarium langsethiae TaxID=179993 RepID=A0A0M9EUG9_FUSLA|nr:het containing protein [Fusarium langsethiae]GKU04487.1 unnamed protein product [Fusarium langsethiae]GKU19975.1 unnamed protein product [Fusarium langsethiae]
MGGKEITFQDITQQTLENLQCREAFYKVQECCAQARRNGYGYVWIDTCCIDKTSSAELSEAINSMFKWYQQASLCYVFLSDFDTTLSYRFAQTSAGRVVHFLPADTSFFSSRWFTRGWTLQELIAPRHVSFFDKGWINFGSRDNELLGRLCHKTGISPQLFVEPRCKCPGPYPAVRDGVCVSCTALDTLPQTLDSFTVSVKMRWASSRVTTRKEDSAYCLLGLFNLNMPMLYGEGDKAFLRLQEATIRQSKDHSILLWRGGFDITSYSRITGCLAPSPSTFNKPIHILGRRVFRGTSSAFEFDSVSSITLMELTDIAMQMDLWICPCTVSFFNFMTGKQVERALSLGILDLAYDDDYLVRPALLLEQLGTINLYRRVYHMFVVPVDPRQAYSSREISVDEGQSVPLTPKIIPDRLPYPSTLKVSRHLNQATQRKVDILRHQSHDNVMSMRPSYRLGPKSGPVYLVQKAIEVRHTSNETGTLICTASSGVSHPYLSNYDVRTTQIPSPWAFVKCQHPGVDRYFGGIHFVSFSVDDQSSSDYSHDKEASGGQVVIIWGMHRKVKADDGVDTPWSPWVFNRLVFIKYVSTSAKETRSLEMCHALNPIEKQVRLQLCRSQLCSANWQHLRIPQDSEQKALFPSSCEDDWAEDRMFDIADDPAMNTHLAIRIVMTEGLGRTLYEIQFDIDQTPKAPQSYNV